MSTYEKAAAIFVDTLPECRGLPWDKAARKLLDALYVARIAPMTFRASDELFRRYHAHCRYLGTETGRGYEDIYNASILYAREFGEWKCKTSTQTVVIADEEYTVDIDIPLSSTKVSNKQLLRAYEYIVDTAAEHKITLPENPGAMDE
jgi:hypothetical protein